MTGPKRIQMRRTKGWRKPEGAIYVGRPGKWGNPFRVQTHGEIAADLFEEALVAALDGRPGDHAFHVIAGSLDDLRGHDLACWCSEFAPCHADVLLDLANRGGQT